MEHLALDIVLIVFDLLPLDDIECLRTAYAWCDVFVGVADDYIARNIHRKVLSIAESQMVEFVDSDHEFSGCTFYPSHNRLRISDVVFESSIGPVTATWRDWTGWQLDLKMTSLNMNGDADGESLQRWRWKWEPMPTTSSQQPRLVSLMIEQDPASYRALQISSTNFLAFQSYYPRSIFQPKQGIIYRNILQKTTPEERKMYFDTSASFSPVFSCLRHLETLILEAPSNYYYKNEEWWYQDKGESEMLSRRSPGTVFYPLEPLYDRLSLMPKLTTLHIALPVQEGVSFANDADILNKVLKASPSLKSLCLSEMPPRTSFSLERVDFTLAPYLQSFELLCLSSPSARGNLWKPLYPNVLGFEVETAAAIDTQKITDNFKMFSYMRDFHSLTVRILIGDEIFGDGINGGEFWWNTVRMEHCWTTGGNRNIVYSRQELCHVWDPFDQYPYFPEGNYFDMFQLDNDYIL
ncbi:hypothetical protein TWF102_006993 [Orbilia oligospora]|uniref:Uncharacterized protein n=1 Tax=Orbilia oligospora TaxID=2813651 RepID=A0A7C8NMA0_ORBOL|nr:hypothetical protein TWF103_005867 [Orbilia oligospora]KAF3111320.1 hypothetical protein TWF102_006993 [Orbilia oligospora]